MIESCNDYLIVAISEHSRTDPTQL